MSRREPEESPGRILLKLLCLVVGFIVVMLIVYYAMTHLTIFGLEPYEG